MRHLGDITKISGYRVEPVNVIIGGSPCQDLSIAGKREGLRHGELGDESATRSGLFMEQLRIIKGLRCAPVRCRIYSRWESDPVRRSERPVSSPWSTKGQRWCLSVGQRAGTP